LCPPSRFSGRQCPRRFSEKTEVREMTSPIHASTFTEPKPRGLPKACARISSDCSSGTVTKYQRPAASDPFQIQRSEVTVITSAREPAVGRPVWPGGFLAQTADLVLLVRLEVPLEPFDAAIVFKGENVRCKAIQEEAVVANHDRTAGEIQARLTAQVDRL